LDVAIGLFFVFLLVSLISQQINDKASQWLRMRAKGMEEGLYKYIVGENNLKEQIYKNPLIASAIPEDAMATQFIEKIPLVKKLIRSPKNPVSIPAGTFSRALFDALIPNASGQTTVSQLRAAITTMPSTIPLRDPILKIIATTENDITKVRTNVEGWFDTTMDKTTKLYQAHMWRFAFGLSLCIAVVLNVDTIRVGRILWTDSALRSALVVEANSYTQKQQNPDTALDKLNALSLPIGWLGQLQPRLCLAPNDWFARPEPGINNSVPAQDPCGPFTIEWYTWPLKLIGWLVTAFAGAQGAPFWFDMLRKAARK